MSTRDEYESVLKLIREWPAEQRAALAHDLSLTAGPPRSSTARPTPSFERALGLGCSDAMPPTDDQGKQ